MEGIYYLGDYHPWRNRQNPRFDAYSRRVLDLKDREPTPRQAAAIEYFVEEIAKYIGSTFAVVAVPSHKPGVTDSGVIQLAQTLARTYENITDATGCLIRTEEIDKLSTGGVRSIEVHLNSMGVRHAHLIRNRDVLVLDDVSTSGNSLKASELLLKNAGVRSVTLMAVGRTAS
jgi:predicted amidophosphoribosyltransferase